MGKNIFSRYIKGVVFLKYNITNQYSFVFKLVYNSGKLIFLISFLSVIVSGISPVISSLVFKKIIDLINYVFFNESIDCFYNAIYLILSYISITIIQDITLVGKAIIYRICGVSLTFNIQNLLVERVNAIHYEKVYSPKFQDEYSNILMNSQNEPLQIVTSLFEIGSLVIQLLINVLILCKFNFIIFAEIIICLIPNIALKLKLKKDYVSLWDRQVQNYRKMNYFFDISTSKTFLKEVRLYGIKDHLSNKRKKHYLDILHIWNHFSKDEFLKTVLTQLIACAGVCVASVWLIFETLNKSFTVSDFIFYWGIIFSLQNLCTRLVSNISSNYESMLFIKKLMNFVCSKEENCFGKALPSKGKDHVFEFRNVSFVYEGSDRIALKNINFNISTGEKICIVGINGSGKTTLINILLRNLLPTSGEVFLDGININDYTNDEYLKLFSCVYQDWNKYAVNLKEYVAFGAIKNLNEKERIESATKKSTAYGFVHNLKEKYESILTRMFDTEGEELSIGQWQKLALSRVFFAESDVYIFDEPTSAVDALSEAEIYKNIYEFSSDKLVILISHRLYVSQKADKILFMKEGSILDIGTHDELMERCNDYAKLFNSQNCK